MMSDITFETTLDNSGSFDLGPYYTSSVPTFKADVGFGSETTSTPVVVNNDLLYQSVNQNGETTDLDNEAIINRLANQSADSTSPAYDQSLEDGISQSWRDKLQADLATEGKTKTLDEILKSYGINDKVAASLIQLGGGMLAGAAKGQMQQKAWDREDALIAKERARRDANAKPGQVYAMNFKPKQTGLLATAK